MRQILIAAAFFTNIITGFAQQTFTIKGKIKGQESGMLKLSYIGANEKQVQDSVAIKNATFEFKGTIAEPTMAYFSGTMKSRDMNDPNYGSFFIEPGVLSLEVTAGDFKNLKLTGSKTQDEYAALEKLKAPIYAQIKPISEEYAKANEVYISARNAKKSEVELDALKEKASDIRNKFEPFGAQQNKLDMTFITTHSDSYLSAYLLRWKVSSMPLMESKNYYAAFSDKVRESSYGKGVLEEIKNLEGGSPGSMASVFSTIDINGAQLSLADFKGNKYVLLDFWASWCVPCRKGNPHLLSLYNKYKDNGFEIVGVSDDDFAPDAWKKAVEKDQIGVWRHVLRGLKRNATGYDKSGDVSEPYGIHSLPTKILIDKDGMIVGRYGEGGDDEIAMDKKLAEIFNK